SLDMQIQWVGKKTPRAKDTHEICNFNNTGHWHRLKSSIRTMIITTLNQLKQHIPVGNSLSFETLLPYIREAEEAILAPNIGEELLTQIDNYLQADILTDIQKELLKRTQLVAARFALSYFIPNGEVIIGD